MILHLFYKEWLKTRWFGIFTLILGLSVIFYIYFDIETQIRLRGAFDYFLGVMYGNPQVNFYRSLLKYFPLFIAVSVGFSQYMPEVIDKRIKLTLHLPIKNTTALYGMLFYGVIMLSAIFILVFGSLMGVTLHFFPVEIALQVGISITPWILGGYATYFLISMIALEPSVVRQLLYGIVSFFLVKQFFIGMEHGDTSHTIGALAIMVAISSIGLFYSSNRFLKGER